MIETFETVNRRELFASALSTAGTAILGASLSQLAALAHCGFGKLGDVLEPAKRGTRLALPPFTPDLCKVEYPLGQYAEKWIVYVREIHGVNDKLRGVIPAKDDSSELACRKQVRTILEALKQHWYPSSPLPVYVEGSSPKEVAEAMQQAKILRRVIDSSRTKAISDLRSIEERLSDPRLKEKDRLTLLKVKEKAIKVIQDCNDEGPDVSSGPSASMVLRGTLEMKSCESGVLVDEFLTLLKDALSEKDHTVRTDLRQRLLAIHQKRDAEVISNLTAAPEQISIVLFGALHDFPSALARHQARGIADLRTVGIAVITPAAIGNEKMGF